MTDGSRPTGSTPATSRVALVTGAGRGIGAAIAERLGADGHIVVVNYSASESGAAAVVERITAAGGTAWTAKADVSDADAVDRMAAAIAERAHAPDVLVNNAGISLHGATRKFEIDAWNRTMAVNLSGAFHCIRAVLPAMHERRWGRIINIGSSAGGRASLAGVAAYSASKAGLAGLTRSLAVELAGRGITVNTVVPGLVETDMIAGSHPDAASSTRSTWPSIPAEAVADLVAYLASDRAQYVSGEDVAAWLGGPRPG